MTEDKKARDKVLLTQEESDNAFLKTMTEACAEIEKCLQKDEDELSKGRIEQLKELAANATNAAATPRLTKLLAKFDALCNKYTDRVHCLYQARDLARWEHYTAKLDLCEQVKTIAKCADNDLPRIARELKLIRLQWKDIGSVPHEKSDEIWKTFCEECDQLQTRISVYYNELEENRKSIFVEKIKICEAAEKIQHSTDWENDARNFKDLQKHWREIGFAGPEQEKQLYIRFRATCDIFFNARKEYYQQAKSERENIVSAKYSLCKEAETIFDLSYSEAHQLIPDLWNRWKLSGSAGKNDRELYERFRACFDTYYEGLRKQRSVNLVVKKKLCDELGALKESVDSGKKQFQDIEAEFLNIKERWDSIGAMPRAEEKPVLEKYFKLSKKLNSLSSKSRESNKDILKRSFALEQIVSSALDSLDSRKMETWKKCQSEWGALDSAEKKYFRDSFDIISAAFDDDSDEYCEQLFSTSNENLKKRRKICAELKNLGIKPEEEATNDDLARELTMAIANNFASEYKSKNPNPAAEKIDQLVKRWLEVGTVPLKNLPQLYKNFEQAMENINDLE